VIPTSVRLEQTRPSTAVFSQRNEELDAMVSVTAATFPLKSFVVADDGALRRFLKETLETRCGYRVTGEGTSAAEMVRTVLTEEPDVVLFDVRLRDGCGLEALRQIYQERPFAAVAITDEEDQELVRGALGDFHLGYLLKPVEPHQVEPAVLAAWARFNVCRQLQSENDNLRATLQSRKLIERAKGVLMKRHRWSEDVAFRRLQRGAMNRRTTMASLAQEVLNGLEVEL
jgi:two-component system, response regulator PdtaR